MHKSRCGNNEERWIKYMESDKICKYIKDFEVLIEKGVTEMESEKTGKILPILGLHLEVLE